MVKASLLLLTSLLTASRTQFRRMLGVEAQNEQYKKILNATSVMPIIAKPDIYGCLALVSVAYVHAHLALHTAVKERKTSTCSGDSDCIKWCRIECSIKICEGKCSCGCHG